MNGWLGGLGRSGSIPDRVIHERTVSFRFNPFTCNHFSHVNGLKDMPVLVPIIYIFTRTVHTVCGSEDVVVLRFTKQDAGKTTIRDMPAVV